MALRFSGLLKLMMPTLSDALQDFAVGEGFFGSFGKVQHRGSFP
jgi:hypothetical protein